MDQIDYFPGGFDFFNKSTGKTKHVEGVVSALSRRSEVVLHVGIPPEINCRKRLYGRFFFRVRILWNISKLLRLNRVLIVRKNWWVLLFLIFFPSNKKKSYLIVEINGFTFERYVSTRIHQKVYKLWLALHAPLSRIVDRYYVVNNALSQDISLFDDIKKTFVGYNGAPLKYEPVERFIGEKSDFVFIGNLRAYNDWNLLRNYFSRNPHHELHIVGFGESESEIYKMSSLRNVTYHGYMERDKYLKLIGELSNPCGLVPVKRHFGDKYLSPIKLGEYLSLGMPVIMSSNIDSVANVTSLSNVLIYETGSESSFKDAVKKICSFTASQKSLLKDYNSITWEKTLEGLLEIRNKDK